MDPPLEPPSDRYAPPEMFDRLVEIMPEQQELRNADYASDDEAGVAELRSIYEQLCTDGDGIELRNVALRSLRFSLSSTAG